MKKEDIDKKLRILKDPDKSETYLRNILKKEVLLNKETRAAIYEKLGELYDDKGKYIESAQSYDKSGKKDKGLEEWRKAANDLLSAGRHTSFLDDFIGVSKALEKGGLKREVKSLYKKALDLTEEEIIREKKFHTGEVGDTSYLREYCERAIRYAIKADKFDEAKKIRELYKETKQEFIIKKLEEDKKRKEENTFRKNIWGNTFLWNYWISYFF